MTTFPSSDKSSSPTRGRSSSPVKAGHRTSEFVVLVLTIIGTVLTAIVGTVPSNVAVYVTLAASIVYTISRTIVKWAAITSGDGTDASQ